ncbi:hypothetical protein ACVWXO_006421 [Bradyrhizobium sp. LM2.7]
MRDRRTSAGPYSAATTFPDGTLPSASENGLFRMHQEGEKPPSSSSPIDIGNGRYQLPVASIKKPATSGETMAAKAEPVFMSPEALPERFGAMSIGIDHIGPITSSAQKKPADRHSTTIVMS